MKKAVTFTICVGTSACPNHCPNCISEMTGKRDYDTAEMDWKAFDRACQVAVNYGAENVLFTGKGEPLLFPELITKYLKRLKKYRECFTRFELQTSGDGLNISLKYFKQWKRLDLDLVAISAYHHDDVFNDEIFRPNAKKINGLGMRVPVRTTLSEKIALFKKHGFKVRLSFVMMKGYIDCVDEVKEALKLGKEKDVFQTTFRALGMPNESRNEQVADFVSNHVLTLGESKAIKEYFDHEGHACDKLPFGGTIYEINGQNACLTTCLDQCENKDELRNLICFPNGMLSTSWEYPIGSAIL